MLIINGVLALVVWAVWAAVFGPSYVHAFTSEWPVALTMVFGSLVGGGTSEGGGAVAFPVLTKLLAVPAETARVFTFAIQSIGMTAASIAILLARVRIERRILLFAAPPAIIGVFISATTLAPLVPAPVVRVLFTAVLVVLGGGLIVQLRSKGFVRQAKIPVWGRRERALVGAAALLGGVLSGIAGVGENTLVFILLVIYFRVSEKVATPTTVILMAAVSVVAFMTHVLLIGDFRGVVVNYWIAAGPVVVVGAPMGAWVCSRFAPVCVRLILIILICIELISTVLLVHFTLGLTIFFIGTVSTLGGATLYLVRSNRYGTLQPELLEDSLVTT